MVVDYFNVCRSGRLARPFETNSPLVIDPNGILSPAVSLQGFQPVGVERGKIAERRCSIENTQAFLALPPERLPLADLFARCQTFRVPVAITPDHPVLYTILDE